MYSSPPSHAPALRFFVWEKMYITFAHGSEAKAGVLVNSGVLKSVLAAMAMASHRELMTVTLRRQRGNVWQVVLFNLTRTKPAQMAYTLFCIVRGDTNLFSVKVDETQTVDELKKAIKSENSHKFENVDAYELTLHQIEINLDLSNEDEYDRILDEVSQPGYVFTAKRKLRDAWEISQYFKQDPERGIHILVELPQKSKSIDP